MAKKEVEEPGNAGRCYSPRSFEIDWCFVKYFARLIKSRDQGLPIQRSGSIW
jgi:hypothetical protein